MVCALWSPHPSAFGCHLLLKEKAFWATIDRLLKIPPSPGGATFPVAVPGECPRAGQLRPSSTAVTRSSPSSRHYNASGSLPLYTGEAFGGSTPRPTRGTDCHIVETQDTPLHLPQSGQFRLCLGFSYPCKGSLRGPCFLRRLAMTRGTMLSNDKRVDSGGDGG